MRRYRRGIIQLCVLLTVVLGIRYYLTHAHNDKFSASWGSGGESREIVLRASNPDGSPRKGVVLRYETTSGTEPDVDTDEGGIVRVTPSESDLLVIWIDGEQVVNRNPNLPLSLSSGLQMEVRFKKP